MIAAIQDRIVGMAPAVLESVREQTTDPVFACVKSKKASRVPRLKPGFPIPTLRPWAWTRRDLLPPPVY